MQDAVSQADIILLAVGFEDAAEALKAAGDLTHKVVVDISNRTGLPCTHRARMNIS